MLWVFHIQNAIHKSSLLYCLKSSLIKFNCPAYVKSENTQKHIRNWLVTETSPTETGTHARTAGRHARTAGRHARSAGRHARTHIRQTRTHALQADTHARTAGRHARTHWTLAAQTHRCWFSLVKFYSPGRLARKNMRKWQGVQNQQKPSPVKCRIYQNSRDSDHFLAQWLPVTVRLLSFWQVSKSKTILLSFLLLNFLRR